MDLNQFRQQYPQYKDIDDETLANSLYDKFYSDKIPKDEFLERIRPVEETAGVVEGFVGGTKRFISSIQTGLTAPLTSGEEASLEGIEREKKITERSATSLENVKRTFKDEGLRAAAGEVVSQVPGAIAEQSPILASIYGGFQLVKNIPGPVGTVAKIVTPMLPIFFSMAGSNMQRKAEEDIAQGKDVDINEVGAYATAFGQTAVERVGLALSGVTRLLGLSALKETGTEAAERLAKESLTKAITKGTAKFAAFEIPTEVSQQMMERYYAGLSLTDDDAMNEYAETAFAVSLMSPIGSFAGYKQRSDAKAIADPVNKDPEIQYNDTKDNEEKDTKELNETADKDLELKQKGDALLNADLDPEKMPVGLTEEEKIAIEQQKILDEEAAEKERIEIETQTAAQQEITGPEVVGPEVVGPEVVGPEVAGFDEAAFRSQLKVNSAEMSAEERKSYLNNGVIPESYIQRKIDEEKRRIENERGQTGPGASLEKGVGAGITASVSATDPSTMDDSAKATEESVGAAVDDSVSNTGGVTGGERGVDPALDKKEKTKFDKKEERQRKKLEKRRKKIIEREATDEEYNIDKPNLVDERTKIRINDFDSPLDTDKNKQKISQEVNSLAKKLKTKVPQFLKTGAVFTSTLEESPFDKSKSTDEHIENTIQDYIFEQGYETKKATPEGFEKGTTRGVDAQGNPIEVTPQELRDERAAVRKEFYDSPILDDYLRRIGETKEEYIDKKVRDFQTPLSAQQITSDAEIEFNRAQQKADDQVLSKEEKADLEIEAQERKEILKEVKKKEQEFKRQGLSPKEAKEEAYAFFGLYSKGKNISFASNSEAKRLLEESPNAEVGIENISRLLDNMIRIAENPKAPLLDPETNRPFTIEKRNEYTRKLKFEREMLRKLSEFPSMKNVKINVVSKKQMRNIELKELDVKGQLSSITGKDKSVILGEYIDARNGKKIGLQGNNIFILGNLTSEQTIETFIHESSHAATVYGMNFMTTEQALEFTRILERAREVAKQQGITKAEGDFYGLTNLQEFVAESLSNNNFSNFLRKTPSGESNLLVRLINAISNLLGFGQVIPVRDTTLFQDIMVQNKRLFDFGVMPTDRAQLLADRQKIQTIKEANLLKEGKSQEIIAKLFKPNERLALKAEQGSETSTRDSTDRTDEEIEASNKVAYEERKGIFSRLATAGYNFFMADNIYDAIGGKETINKVNQRFVDISYPLKALEEQLRGSKQLIIGEDGFNNFYEQATLMHGVAQNHLKALMPVMREFEQSMADFIELYKQRNPGKDDSDARAYAQRLLTAQHEAERREVVHMISVPLSTKPTMKYVDKDGKTRKISPAEMREEIMGIITDSKTKIDKAQLDKYKKRLLDLADPANNYVDGIEGKSYGDKNPTPKIDKKTGKRKAGGTVIATNIADSEYDVTAMSYNDGIRIRNELNQLKNTDPQFYEALTNIQKDMNRIQRGQIKNELAPEGIKGILELAQIANFAPMQSQNIIDMYGWDYYIPLKGKMKNQSESDRTIETMYDDSGGALSTKLKKYDAAMEGGQKDAADPFTQVIVDASQAAARAGRIGFTTAIFNGIKNVRKYTDVNGNIIKDKDRRGIIDGKIEKEFTFQERHRNDPEIEKLLKRKDTVVHFKPDGSLVVMSIKDPKILAAVRGLPREDNLLLDVGNTVTGAIGQLHTRFNVKFAPLNFVRDAITNLYLVGSDLGYKDMVGYKNAIASQLKGNLIHTGKIVKFYIEGDVQKARAYANKLNKKGNPYGLTMLDYLQQGGMVSITASLSNRTALQQQQKDIKAGKPARTKQVILDYFDTYMGMFELAARVSVFSVYRDNYLAKNSPGRTINNTPKNILNAANQSAAAYAKNLSNFEKMGTAGRTLGAWFMFFRASMVGASRAMQSLAPALITTEQAVADLDPTIRGNPDDLAEFIKDYEIKRRRAQTMAVSLLGIGATLYMLAAIANEAAEDDEGNKTLDDDLSRWTRYARMPLGFVPGFDEDDVLQIPWGFGLGGLPAIGTQVMGLAFSNENSKASIVGNILNITLDSFAPFPVSKMDPFDSTRGFAMWAIDSATPTILRPIFEYATNTNAFGSPISNLQTSRRYGSAYQVRGSTPAMFQDLTQAIAEGKFLGIGEPGEYDIDPNILYFFANNYADGAATLAQNFYSFGLTAAGKKEFEAKFDTIILGSFFSKYSDIDQRKFARTSQEISKLESKLNLFKGANPVLYYDTLNKYPVAPTIIARYNDHKGELNKITAQINAIKRDSTIDRKTKGAILEPLEYYQKMIKRQMINMVEQEITDGLLE